MQRFWDKVNIQGPDECWEWVAATSKYGYGQIKVNGKTIRAHRLAWELFNNQEIPEGMLILHSCDNRPCCNPGHLRFGTVKENQIDMSIKGRSMRGEKGTLSKLTDGEVRLILKDPRSHREIANDFPVSRKQINNIKNGKSWGHLHV